MKKLLRLSIIIGATALALSVAPVASATPAVNICELNPYAESCRPHPAPQKYPIQFYYMGWAKVDANYCAPGFVCAEMFRTSVVAWIWEGSQWRQSSLPHGTRVYAWPFGWGYHWAWTQQTGWVAVETNVLFRV